jgi:hypothetical protein
MPALANSKHICRRIKDRHRVPVEFHADKHVYPAMTIAPDARTWWTVGGSHGVPADPTEYASYEDAAPGVKAAMAALCAACGCIEPVRWENGYS